MSTIQVQNNNVPWYIKKGYTERANNSGLSEERVHQITQEYFKKHEEKSIRKELKSAVHNPWNNVIYLEDPEMRRRHPKAVHFSYPAIDREEYEKQKGLHEAGQVSGDKLLYSAIFQEFLGEATEYWNRAKRWYSETFNIPNYRVDDAKLMNFFKAKGGLAEAAGIVTSSAFGALQTALVVNSFLDREEVKLAKYNLVDAVTQRDAGNRLTIKNVRFDGIPRPMIRQVNENDEIEPADFGTFTQEIFRLKKWGGSYYFSEEFQMQEGELEYNIRQMHNDRLADEFTKIKNDQLAGLLPSFANITGASFTDMLANGMHNANKPQLTMNTLKKQLEDNDGVLEVIISNDTTYTNYESNTWINGNQVGAPSSNVGQRTITNVPKLTGVTWYINNTIADNVLYGFQRDAIGIMQGPRKALQTSKDDPEVVGNIVKEWFESHVFDPNKCREVVSI